MSNRFAMERLRILAMAEMMQGIIEINIAIQANPDGDILITAARLEWSLLQRSGGFKFNYV